MKKFIQEFKEFALKGNMMDLAIGMIIGSAFTGIVNSLVNDIINPILGIFTGEKSIFPICFSPWTVPTTRHWPLLKKPVLLYSNTVPLSPM